MRLYLLISETLNNWRCYGKRDAKQDLKFAAANFTVVRKIGLNLLKKIS
jgi:hypothetical protein